MRIQNTSAAICVMRQYTNGAEVQVKERGGVRIGGEDIWADVSSPAWDWASYEYRVRPEPVLRPWEANEVPLNAIIRRRDNLRARRIITGVTDQGHHTGRQGKRVMVCVGGSLWVPATEVLKIYEMEDGEPCGILMWPDAE